MSDPNEPLDQYAEKDTQARFSENQEIARQLRAVRAELGSATAEKLRLETEVGALGKVYEEALILQPEPDWLRKSKGKAEAHRATLVAFLSDLHAGEVVRPEEMGGYNAFNLNIADLRLQRFFEKTIDLARTYFAGVTYDGIVLALGGDLVSGDIHEPRSDP